MGTETFRITREQAELYEERFVPALFRNWVDLVLDGAGVHTGQRLLDVACGTGVVARSAADRVGSTGAVIGLDLNPAMLAVARDVRPELDWRAGDAGEIPFADDDFDVVTCQAGLMFFPDPTAALREMGRVTRPGGVVAVQVFSALSSQPAYGPWIEMVARHAGAVATEMLGTYWVHGDPGALRARCTDAGLRVVAQHDDVRPAYFPSVEAMVLTEVNATPLADRLQPAELRQILTESEHVLGRFRNSDRLEIPIAGYVLVATPT
ncbi:class I SAM-dependent methyltransferase [Kribbella shirazensis]|uniref:SAM-dependent methyltransferase n=1 Tax=Kribbella shirazensis TaxID=1105143 RepID=A0A7X5VCY0_9ACTN|nr:class I SAM-dependent methyltransferase [Kribbella shirazensis]NIK58207.1 SAM-dependent methyltransferase [Kribbella shirazensis]